MSQAAPQLFHRAVEVALGVSLNAQSQASDIPDVPLRAVSSCYAVSLPVQDLAPDIHLVSLCGYMEELSVSFNTQDQAPDDLVSSRTYTEELSTSLNAQDQAPDDFYAQDRCRAPSIFDEHSRKDGQLLARLLTKQDISHFFLQLLSQDSAQELFERSISPNHGDSRPQDSQYVPCIFVDNPRRACQVLARLHPTQVISHFFPSTSVTRQCTGTL